MGTAFSYQGRLNDGAGVANGSYDFRFSLFNQGSGGIQVGGNITNSAVVVSNGLFNVTLDFGASAFNGSARWLAVGVRTNGTNAFLTLDPLQPLLPEPYAMVATSASNVLGTMPATQLTGILPSGQLSGTYANPLTFSSASGTFTGAFTGNGIGLTNLSVPATSLTGTIPLARMPSAVVTNTQTGVTLSGTFSGNGAGLTGVPAMTWQAVSGTSQQAQPNNGYVAANAGLVTITLPGSPAVGSIVRVSGAGAGGWKIAQNAGQSIIAANLGIVGGAWTARDSTRNWRCVASSADGTKLVAGVDGGQLYTSTDSGATWTARESIQGWYCVASSADGTKLVAGANNGRIYASTSSGASWTPYDSARQWYGVASSADGVKLVAVVNGGQIYTSTTSGTSWSPHESGRSWSAVASSSDGTRLVAVVSGGQIYTSADSGSTWIARETIRSWSAVACSSDGARLVAAVNNGQLYTSSNSGTNWQAHDSARLWSSLASSADGASLVAAVNDSIAGQLFLSTDSGVTWSARESGRAWRAVACSSDGAKLVAVVYNGQIYTSNPPYTTAGTAGYLLGGQNSAVELQYIGNNQFLPLSHEGSFAVY